MLEKSIMNNWQDIYEPKEEKAQVKQPSTIMGDFREMEERINKKGLFG